MPIWYCGIVSKAKPELYQNGVALKEKGIVSKDLGIVSNCFKVIIGAGRKKKNSGKTVLVIHES